MSPECESGLLASDGIRGNPEVPFAGSSPEVANLTEPAPPHHQSRRTPREEVPTGDPLFVVILRGVSVVAGILMPLAAIALHFSGAMTGSYESRSRLAVGAGLWAILAMWIILDKGLVSLLEQAHESPAPGWLLLGLSNLGAALGTISYLVSTQR
jgi:hypothetical protein